MAVDSETYMAVCGEVQDLRRQLAKSEARVAELEADNEHQRERRNAARECIKKMGDGSPWLLRKQAEAVEKSALLFPGRELTDIRCSLHTEAQRLRQQAERPQPPQEGE
ncbi:hypothetical protein [uncultured Marinobacter sp.]|uniref:hypothetical protein n=1 Tax=uncultured Marinobacter sp. TaxID=187379 RepID=UPI0025948F9A|nr:hypothetical protein [uncultured Marinobacter sp.]